MGTSTSGNTIVLIHGLWLTSESWEHWVERFQKRGHRVIARNWPGMEGTVEDIRRDPSKLEHVGVGEIASHYESIIRELDRPPIIMGHSFGGLITQILLDRGLGVAGVALDSAPAKGILALPWSTLKSGFPVLKNPANAHRTVTLTADEFHYAFTNTMSERDSETIYRRQAVPGPGRVLFQAAFANFAPHAATKVHFENDQRAPLLLITGGEDHVSPPAISAETAKLQHRSKALTAFKVFPGRAHFILGQPGWEEVADFALDWAVRPVEIA